MSEHRPSSPTHELRPMRGRDPNEAHRVATPLELLCDLTFVVAFSFAGNGLAHAVSAGHVMLGVCGFVFAMFGILWAWINFAWFASAFDTDDWGARLATMLQMLGVLILAVGIAPMFKSLESGGAIDNRVMVLGYMVMRVALVTQWLRVARHDPAHARTAKTYAAAILLAQLGWCALAVLETSVLVFAICATVLLVVEMLGPWIAEHRKPTPWHAHHIAERYGLLVIIALGEIIVGTATALDAAATLDGWNWEAALVGISGVAMALGMWWVYFILPAGQVLHAHRSAKSFAWGYSHILLFAAIAAVGAGLHVCANALAAHADGAHAVSPQLALACGAAPLACYVAYIYAIYAYLMETFDRYHIGLLLLSAFMLVLPFVLLVLHVPLPVCLLVLALAPLVSVIGYERHGHAHIDSRIALVTTRE